MLQAVFIPGWFPTPLNKLMGGHWGTAHRRKSADAETVCRSVRAGGIVPASGPRRVDLHLVVPKGKRRCDRDAFWKSSKDALVQCGALVDDTPRLCRDGQTTFSRADDEFCGTLILLEDL